jgi:hypothetical protein
MVERNVTRAAVQLAMTQPAVSNALRRLRPLLPPHRDDPQIGIRASGLRILRQDPTKRTLSQIEVIILQSSFAVLK